MLAQVAPEADAIDLRHDERGDREDRGGHQRFAHRRRGARNVLLEQAAAKRREAKQRHRDHGGGNRRAHGLPGLHPEIRVGGPEYEGKKDAQRHRLDRKLSWFPVHV